LLIPLRAEEERPPEESQPQPLKKGAYVRVVRAPYLGAMGTVADLPSAPQTVESGARLQVAVVDLEGEGSVAVPLSNLELIR
jgi:hypothetical protein